MNRSCHLLALVVVAVAIVGCSRGVGGATDAPSASPSVAPSLAQGSPDPSPNEAAPGPTTAPSASPTPSPVAAPSTEPEPAIDPATVLAADGIGPYVVGARLSKLESLALVTNLEPSFNCDDQWQSTRATGRYADQLIVTFHLDRLIDVHTNSSELVTPSGARVGMPLAELQRIYDERGTLITGASGNQAFSVRVPDTALGVVFYLDDTNTTILSISAGKVERLEIAAVVGEGC
jgi:hypothetical protein